jgi:hypothetical protein
MNGGTYPGSSFCAAFPAFERGELLWQRFVCARFACLSCLRISTPIVSEHLLQWLMGNLGPYTVAPGVYLLSGTLSNNDKKNGHSTAGWKYLY